MYSLQQKIVDFVDEIKRNPVNDIEYFLIDGNKFIVDGKKIPNLPSEYEKFRAKNEFYLYVDPEKRSIQYFSYNILTSDAGAYSDIDEGNINWQFLEKSLFNFFVLHIGCLSSSIGKSSKKAFEPSSHINKPSENTSAHHNPNVRVGNTNTPPYNPYGSSNYSNNYAATFNTDRYKMKEAFFDKVKSYIKDNNSSSAANYVSERINALAAEEKFDDIDFIFRFIDLDKFNTYVMLSSLKSMKPIAASLKERKDYLDKVKTHLAKNGISSAKISKLLVNIE